MSAALSVFKLSVQNIHQLCLFKNISNTVKATDFKFDVHVSRDSPDMTTSRDPLSFWSRELTIPMHLVRRTATKCARSACVTKFVISHFLIYFCNL